MTYHLVHQLHRDGFSISYISKYFVLDWRTVKRYLNMTETEYEAFLLTLSVKKKIFLIGFFMGCIYLYYLWLFLCRGLERIAYLYDYPYRANYSSKPK